MQSNLSSVFLRELSGERDIMQAHTASQRRKRAKDTASRCVPAPFEEVFNYCNCSKYNANVHLPVCVVLTLRWWTTPQQLSQSIQTRKPGWRGKGAAALVKYQRFALVWCICCQGAVGGSLRAPDEGRRVSAAHYSWASLSVVAVSVSLRLHRQRDGR